MKKVLLAVCCALLLAGCGDRAREVFETAQFEEQQFNEEHAAELYRQVLERYPDSPYAPQARQRLETLEGR